MEEWEYKPFSEWAKEREMGMEGAGIGYDELSDLGKKVLDSAIERYVTARLTPKDINTLDYQLQLCDCGHQRRDHVKAINAKGLCRHNGCECKHFEQKRVTYIATFSPANKFAISKELDRLHSLYPYFDTQIHTEKNEWLIIFKNDWKDNRKKALLEMNQVLTLLRDSKLCDSLM